MLPSLLVLDSPTDYKRHYERHYQRGTIITADGIRVYFQPQKFGHAFYENSQHRAGAKDAFSPTRAQRIDWIKLTLEHPEAAFYEGWNKAIKCYESNRRVSVVFDDFVVVIELSLKRNGTLKANFITCYVADRSMEKIRQSPEWDKDKCLIKLARK